MYCAECGQKMTRIENGASLRCCHGYGYWADIEPDPRAWPAKRCTRRCALARNRALTPWPACVRRLGSS